MSDPAAPRGLDPITVEVVRNKLDGIAGEMQQTLLRASFSPIVKEGLDASAGLFTAGGETLAQATAIPMHLSTLIPVMERILKTFPRASMQPGDAYLMNDPYFGGTHLPDIAVVVPIFDGATIVAFSATMTHHQDMGGMSPGSLPTNATEIFQEGLRLPPLQLIQNGVENHTLIEIIKLNVRIPDVVIGDLRAQISACRIGARRTAELSAAFGAATACTIFGELLDRSERLTRAALATIPPGTFRYTDCLDNDGVDLDKPVKIVVAVSVADGKFHVDLTGSAPQTRGPFNAVRSSVLAGVLFSLRAVTDPDIPNNGGCFRVVKLTLPEASVVNPRSPAPVNARSATVKRIAGCILGALKDAMPTRVPADAAGEMLSLSFGGVTPDGRSFVTGEIIASGSGAGFASDGVDVIETDVTNCMNLPVEAMEMEMPFRTHRLALRDDSGGPGRHRGGLGLRKEYEILADEVVMTYRGERHYFAPAGSQGGMSGTTAHAVVVRKDGSEEVVPSKLVARLYKGDRLRMETAGGGGYGAPSDRDRDDLARDIADGKVTLRNARSLYGYDGPGEDRPHGCSTMIAGERE